MLDNTLSKLVDKIDELQELAEELETDFTNFPDDEYAVEVSADELYKLIGEIENFKDRAYKLLDEPKEYEPDWDLKRDERRFDYGTF